MNIDKYYKNDNHKWVEIDFDYIDVDIDMFVGYSHCRGDYIYYFIGDFTPHGLNTYDDIDRMYYWMGNELK